MVLSHLAASNQCAAVSAISTRIVSEIQQVEEGVMATDFGRMVSLVSPSNATFQPPEDHVMEAMILNYSS